MTNPPHAEPEVQEPKCVAAYREWATRTDAYDPDYISRIDMLALLTHIDTLTAQLAEAQAARTKEENDCLEVIDERDRMHDVADELAAHIVWLTGGSDVVAVIGEHSSANDPWANALKLGDSLVTQNKAERAALQSRLTAAETAREDAEALLSDMRGYLHEHTVMHESMTTLIEARTLREKLAARMNAIHSTDQHARAATPEEG